MAGPVAATIVAATNIISTIDCHQHHRRRWLADITKHKLSCHSRAAIHLDIKPPLAAIDRDRQW